MKIPFKNTFFRILLTAISLTVIYQCEPDPDNLGEQFFLENSANVKSNSYDLNAYNIVNNDTIRTDATVLGSATLGAFKENHFGTQKASYYTQVRMTNYDPDFGANPIVDSVVMVIKPNYAADSITTTTLEDYIYPVDNVPAKKVVNTYPVTKYGNTKLNSGKLTIQVQEVTEFMKGYNDIVFSNKNFTTHPDILGSKVFDGNVNSVVITKDADNSNIFTSDVGFRMPLSKDFFQSKIINKKGQPELKDMSNFIRYFRGLKLSVLENDGYLFQFSPSTVQVIIYYKKDKVENGTTTRDRQTFTLNLGIGNAHVSNYFYDRVNTTYANSSIGNATGDTRLFAQGMGGNSIGVKFPKETIDQLKALYQDNKAAIISAKIKMYTDPTLWNNKYTRPTALTFVQKDKDDAGKPTTQFTADYLYLRTTPGFEYVKAVDIDKNPMYYEFNVTQSLKDIVEGGKEYQNKSFKIDIGNFLLNSASTDFAGASLTTRSFSTPRMLFVGSNPSGDNAPYEIKLNVVYGVK